MTPPSWVRHEIGSGNPLGACHAPLSGIVRSLLVSWHLRVIGNQGCAPRETGVGLNMGLPRLGIVGCFYRRFLILGFSTKVGREAATLVHPVSEDKKGGSGSRAGPHLEDHRPNTRESRLLSSEPHKPGMAEHALIPAALSLWKQKDLGRPCLQSQFKASKTSQWIKALATKSKT